MKKERRRSCRFTLPVAGQLSAEIRTDQNHSLSAKVINWSSEGALFEIDRHQGPLLRVNEHVSVKIRLRHDVVWLAGTVRHSYASRLGVFFPAGTERRLNNSLFLSSSSPRATHRRAPQEVLHAI